MRPFACTLTLLLLSCAGSPEPSTRGRFAAEARREPQAEAAAAFTPPRLRLPDQIRPLRNAAALTIVPTDDSFQGEMRIEIEIRTPTPVIWLNADNLDIARAELVRGGATLPARIVTGGRAFVGLAFAAPLAAGRASLRIDYRGVISRTELDGASRQNEGDAWYVYTHFEPLYARRVFPCFDEPSFKVPWQLTLRVKKQDTALSNTPVISRQEGKDGFVTVHFAETKPLPSYLIAFAVGPFGIVDAGKAGLAATPVRVITPHGKEAWARFAVESTGPILSLLEAYFEGPYPYGKLDLIAVPVAGGAMENPGLVTFAQSLILSDPKRESSFFRRNYASIAAHELAHQWFGDLVTTAWWDDLWLNEAFATWMQRKIPERYHPEWDAATERAAAASSAMHADSMVSARQIRQPITSNDDIRNAFDGITYTKGASVIAMVERWVGAAAFQRGVVRYMREHAHAVATARDFLGAISAEAKRDIAPAFWTFLNQPGVPLVGVELSCDSRAAKLMLSQSRYLPLGAQATTRPTVWQIPICARFGAQGQTQSACTLLTAERGELALPTCPDWIVPNDAASGYYHTGYDPATLARVTEHIEFMSPPEKLALVGDLTALARAGRLDYSALLGLTPALARSDNEDVLNAAMGVIETVRDLPLIDAEDAPAFGRFVRSAFGARARGLGLRSKPREGEATRRLRPGLIEIVADQGQDQALRAACTKLARAWLTDKSAIEPDLVGRVLGVAASFGDRALFDAYVTAAKHAPERADRHRLIGALGQFREPALVAAALSLTLSNDFDPRESIDILRSQTRLPEGARAAYAFLTANFDALAGRLPREWGADAPSVGAAMCDDSRSAEVEAFFKDRAKTFTGGPRSLAQALEALRLCSTFREAQTPNVKRFLATQPPRK